MSSLLRVRGTAAPTPPTAGVSSTLTIEHGGSENYKESFEAAKTALQSMQFCYRMCFISVLADLVGTFLDGTIIRLEKWADYVAVFSSLSPLIFGVGVWYMTKIYHTSYLKSDNDFNKRMTQENLILLFQSKSYVWGILSTNVILALVSLAAALPTIAIGKNGLFPFWLGANMSTKQSSLATISIIVAGGLIIRHECGRSARMEYHAYRERNGIDKLNLRPKLDVIRAAGFRAYLNQALCAGSFGMMGVLQLIKWNVMASFDWNLFSHALTVYDFLTPFALSWLLFLLNKATVPAFIAEILGDPTRVDHHEEIYHNLFQAGSKFYNKVGETLKSAAIFRLLPHVASILVRLLWQHLEKIFSRR